MLRQVDVNRPELFCPCPEMARHEAAGGVGVPRVMVQPHGKPCQELVEVWPVQRAGRGSWVCFYLLVRTYLLTSGTTDGRQINIL